MKLAVCQAPADMAPGGPEWRDLADRARALQPDILVLNELPFGPWIAEAPERDEKLLAHSQKAHAEGLARLGELDARAVLGSQAVRRSGRSVNEGYLWEESRGIAAFHTKTYFPEEAGYWEARWYEPGDRRFEIGETSQGLKFGFLICTDVMFNERARQYGRQGAQLIAVPRATELRTLWRWKHAVAMAAIVSGCYVASSNRCGEDSSGRKFGGAGWIFDPYGELIAETHDDEPVVAVELDLERVAAAQRDYPCYVKEI